MVWGILLKNHKSYFSIKRRLTGSVIAVACGLVILSLYCSFQAARHEIKEVYDARLGQTAKLILNVTSISPNEQNKIFHHEQLEQWMRNIQKVAKIDDDKDSEYGHPYEQNTLLQLYQNGELAWSSNPSMEPLSSKSNFDGYGDIYVQGDQWRFFRLHSTPEQYVVVAEKQSIRQEMINEIAFSTALPQLALIPILVLLVIFLINKNFQPISELRSAIAQRNAHKLDRIYVENQTFELSPLVETINELLQQLEQAWQREKRFTNMAAHELKTPLTILRLNAENALNTKDQEQLSEDLNNILQGIDRTDRLLHQLLTLARVGSITCLNKKPLQLQDILKETLAHLAPLAIKNNQELSFSGGSSFIMGDELLLSIFIQKFNR